MSQSIMRRLKRLWLRPVIRVAYGFWPQRYWSQWEVWHGWLPADWINELTRRKPR